MTYTYGDPDHVHAVTALSNGSTYSYDANGNQICRVENSQTFVQIYNAENRFAGAMLVSGTCASPGDTLASWVFTYDGDGTRVKQVYTDSTSTLTTYYFFGGAYEVQNDGSTETILKYYSFAGGMVVMYDGTSLKYLLTDHLSSVIAVLDASGNLLSEQRYLPFGGVRDDVGGITQTDFGYTSQRDLPDLGLMDYKARFYSPYINHFTQPDSIVPSLYNPQSLNRYSYVYNRPNVLNDPTGHLGKNGNICTDDGYCGTSTEEFLDGADDSDQYSTYSNWEWNILTNLLDKGGREGNYIARFMITHDIHITVGEEFEYHQTQSEPSGNIPNFGYSTGDWQSEFEIGAWYVNNKKGTDWVVLNPNVGYSVTADPGIYGYAAVAHEAKHLEQGPSIANSVEGEWEAFRFGVTVLMNLEGIPSSEEIAVMSETTLQGYYSEVNKQYPGYPIELLPMYPQPNLLMGIYHSCIWRYVIPRFVLLP